MIRSTYFTTACLAAALLAPMGLQAQMATAPATQPTPAAESEGFETFSARASYMMGRQVGASFANYDIDLDDEMLMRGLREGLAAAAAEAKGADAPEGSLTDQQLREAELELNVYARQKQFELQQQAMERQQEMLREAAKTNRLKSDKFLEDNGKREEIKTTESGLQYVILKEGEGDPPKAEDVVLMQMTMAKPGERPFFNTRDQGEPAPVPVKALPLAGWVEALQLLKPGATGKFYLPPDLAFGDQGIQQQGINVGPGEVVELEIELLEVNPEAATEGGGKADNMAGEEVGDVEDAAPATQPGK